MKASSSPCPFNQISVLVLKKCHIVTLIDLKNAFGEVHHELILRFHHIPRSIEKVILHLYDGFHISVAANGFLTDPIPVQREILQGDCLSL